MSAPESGESFISHLIELRARLVRRVVPCEHGFERRSEGGHNYLCG